MPSIGDLIVRRRRELGHNQAVAAKVLGVSGPTVSRWETGEATPANEQIDALVSYLGVSEPVVLSAIHRQATAEESDDRVVTLIGEVLEQMAQLRDEVRELRGRS